MEARTARACKYRSVPEKILYRRQPRKRLLRLSRKSLRFLLLTWSFARRRRAPPLHGAVIRHSPARAEAAYAAVAGAEAGLRKAASPALVAAGV
jgi:hypothetical protein